MVLARTESTLYNANSSFGEIINKFQDCNAKYTQKKTKKNKTRTLERKKKKTPKQQGFDFI